MARYSKRGKSALAGAVRVRVLKSGQPFAKWHSDIAVSCAPVLPGQTAVVKRNTLSASRMVKGGTPTVRGAITPVRIRELERHNNARDVLDIGVATYTTGTGADPERDEMIKTHPDGTREVVRIDDDLNEIIVRTL